MTSFRSSGRQNEPRCLHSALRKALGHFGPIRIVRRENHDSTRAVGIGEEGGESPFDDRAPFLQLRILLGLAGAESAAHAGGGHDEPITHGTTRAPSVSAQPRSESESVAPAATRQGLGTKAALPDRKSRGKRSCRDHFAL